MSEKNVRIAKNAYHRETPNSNGPAPSTRRSQPTSLWPISLVCARGRTASMLALIECTAGQTIKVPVTLTQARAIGEGVRAAPAPAHSLNTRSGSPPTDEPLSRPARLKPAQARSTGRWRCGRHQALVPRRSLPAHTLTGSSIVPRRDLGPDPCTAVTTTYRRRSARPCRVECARCDHGSMSAALHAASRHSLPGMSANLLRASRPCSAYRPSRRGIYR